MKNIKGYVFLAKLVGSEREFLFGRKSETDGPERVYGDFESNGFKSYVYRRDVLVGAQNYVSQNSNVSNVDLAQIRLKIAENEEDLSYFIRRSDLIVILYGSSLNLPNGIMFGDIVSEKPNSLPLPGAELRDNGYVPFRKSEGKHPFTLADSLRNELTRQANSLVAIAQFKLKRIGNVFRNT
ncbi:hypothetical protein J4423_03190 [Candidatus Pacearchaeota archaeon]|nr:hypothetical protein [Candidatus Pacearchaeota archaeon]